MDRFDVALALALLVGVALVGQVVGLLESVGFGTYTPIIWLLGYGGIVLTAWYVWIRPLDIHSPDRDDDSAWETDADEQPEK